MPQVAWVARRSNQIDRRTGGQTVWSGRPEGRFSVGIKSRDVDLVLWADWLILADAKCHVEKLTSSQLFHNRIVTRATFYTHSKSALPLFCAEKACILCVEDSPPRNVPWKVLTFTVKLFLLRSYQRLCKLRTVPNPTLWSTIHLI